MVYAICDDGPCAGHVTEAELTEKEIRITDGETTHRYQRFAFGCSSKSSRIARYQYIGTL